MGVCVLARERSMTCMCAVIFLFLLSLYRGLVLKLLFLNVNLFRDLYQVGRRILEEDLEEGGLGSQARE